MKTTLILTSLILLTSCGKTRYVENPYDNSDNEERFSDLENRINILESKIADNIAEIEKLGQLPVYNPQLITDLSNSVESLQIKLTTLQTGDSVQSVTNPCPSKTAVYEEVLFRLGSGKFVAYFENGTNRFMLILRENVHYQTTDTRQCKFYIRNGNVFEGSM